MSAHDPKRKSEAPSNSDALLLLVGSRLDLFCCRHRKLARPTSIEVLHELQRSVACEPRAVKLERFCDLFHVVARLSEGDALDPVDRIDTRVARIAELFRPLLHAAASGVVSGTG